MYLEYTLNETLFRFANFLALTSSRLMCGTLKIHLDQVRTQTMLMQTHITHTIFHAPKFQTERTNEAVAHSPFPLYYIYQNLICLYFKLCFLINSFSSCLKEKKVTEVDGNSIEMC